MGRSIQTRLAQQLPELLSGGPLQHLDADTLAELLASLPPPAGCHGVDHEPCKQDCADVRSFAWGARTVSTCRYALTRAVLNVLRPPRQQLGAHADRVIMDLLQNRPVPERVLRQVARRLPWAQPPYSSSSRSSSNDTSD